MIELTKQEINLILSFIPSGEPPPKGLMPMFYHTLSYEGDLELSEGWAALRSKLDQLNGGGE